MFRDFVSFHNAMNAQTFPETIQILDSEAVGGKSVLSFKSKFEPPGEPHHITGVDLSSDSTKPRHISPIHVLQRRIE